MIGISSLAQAGRHVTSFCQAKICGHNCGVLRFTVWQVVMSQASAQPQLFDWLLCCCCISRSLPPVVTIQSHSFQYDSSVLVWTGLELQHCSLISGSGCPTSLTVDFRCSRSAAASWWRTARLACTWAPSGVHIADVAVFLSLAVAAGFRGLTVLLPRRPHRCLRPERRLQVPRMARRRTACITMRRLGLVRQRCHITAGCRSRHAADSLDGRGPSKAVAISVGMAGAPKKGVLAIAAQPCTQRAAAPRA